MDRKMERYDIEKELREWFRDAGRVVVVGVGNPIRMDDFVGMKIVQDLKGRVDAERVMLIEAETVPENYLQEITEFKPTHMLIVDAAKIGLKPSESRLLNSEKLVGFPAFSTHMLPLQIFSGYIMKAIKTKIALLLIEPRNTEFGEGLTAETTASVLDTVNVLLKILA